jgi:hypothetical protein
MIKSVFSMNKLVAFTGIAATLMLSSVPAWGQSKIPQNEMSYCMATLTAQDSGSRINLRSGPGTNFQQQGYGLVGDRVHILRKPGSRDPQNLAVAENQGAIWYKVGFPISGARGWIHGDFLSPECFN